MKITTEIKLDSNQIKDILIKFLHARYNLTGIFDIDFQFNHIKTSTDRCNLSGAIIKVSENENLQK